METIKDWLLDFKYWLTTPLHNFKVKHTICCPNCHKIYHRIKKFEIGQNTLCKNCRKLELFKKF